MKTFTRPFKIFLPATEDQEARHVETIEVKVYLDENGEEVLTQESMELIERVNARHRGLLNGEEIKALRNRLGLTQEELAELIQCGQKSLSRWENGRGYPSRLVNTMLRALEERLLTPANLKSLQGARRKAYSPPESAIQEALRPGHQKVISTG